jgi:hypothetical protein
MSLQRIIPSGFLKWLFISPTPDPEIEISYELSICQVQRLQIKRATINAMSDCRPVPLGVSSFRQIYAAHR